MMNQHPEHVAFEVEHHALVGTVDFPFDQLDGGPDRGDPLTAELDGQSQ